MNTMNGPAKADLIIQGCVVTMDAARTVIDDGAVAVANGQIVAVGPAAEIRRNYVAERSLADSGAVVLPGFADCHTHSGQAVVRGLIAGELPMVTRLYIPADDEMTPEETYLGTKLCAAQLALSGVTSVCDFATERGPEFEEAVIRAHADMGMRCTLLRGRGDQTANHVALYAQITDKSTRKVTEKAAEKDLRRTEELLRRAAASPGRLLRVGVSPSSLLNFSEHYITAAHALAKEHDVSYQVHAARDREEVEFCLAVYGTRPIERLAKLGVIDERLVIVHGVLATDTEIELLGQGHASLAHSPVECVNLLGRVPTLGRWRAAGVNIGIGCDNAINDMFVALHTAWAMQVGIHGMSNYEPNIVTEPGLLAMATRGAARLLRQDSWTGSIEVGKAADLTVLDGRAPHMFPVQDVMTDLVRFAGRANVRHVLVNGRFVVEDHRNATVDVEKLAHDIKPVATRLNAFVKARRYLPLPCF